VVALLMRRCFEVSRACGRGRTAVYERLLYKNVQRFRGGLVFKAQRLLYESTLCSRIIKDRGVGRQYPGRM